MQDMDTDLLNFDAFFSTNNDEEVDDLWDLTTGIDGQDDEAHELLSAADLEPLSPQRKQEQPEPHDRHDQPDTDTEQPQVRVKTEPSALKQSLHLDTRMANTSHDELVHKEGGWLAQCEDVKTPTATLPARFALLSTTCVYQPGFTTSPRGKRRISQTVPAAFDLQEDEEDEEGDEEDEQYQQIEEEDEDEEQGEDGEPFDLSEDDGYDLPVFTDAELSAMVDSPSKASTTSTNSEALSPLRGLGDAMPQLHSSVLAPSSLAMAMQLPVSLTQPLIGDSGGRINDQDIPDAMSLFNSIYDSSQSFLAAQQSSFDLMGPANNSNVPASMNLLMPTSQAMFATTPLFPFTAMSSTSTASTSNAAPSTPVTNTVDSAPAFDYFSPSGYAAAANQFLDSHQQHLQPFFLNPDALSPLTKATFFPGFVDQQTQPNAQIAAAMALVNSAAAMNSTMRKMNATFGVPIAPLQRRETAAPIKPRLAVARAASSTSVLPQSTTATTGKASTRFAITPDIADFKLVQIFHQFCDPTSKLLTLPGFQQLLLHHQVKEEGSGAASSSTESSGAAGVVAPDAQTLFQLLDLNGVGVLDLERFMHSFQICNRCTEAKRRAHQALCASQGQAFSPSALERQLMEDVAPVVVRVVPTRFEGCKVKSCEHYQWTWCEGFAKTGNEKCRGTNRHDKCPKYLANCTLWKHKLPPKSRKPKVALENVDSPTKKLNVDELLDGALEDKLLGGGGDKEQEVETTTTEDEAWRQRRQQELQDEADMSMSSEHEEEGEEDREEGDADQVALIWDLNDRNTVRAVAKETVEVVEEDEELRSEDEDAVEEEEDEIDTARLTRESTRTTEDSYASLDVTRGNETQLFSDELDQADLPSGSFLASTSPSSFRGSNDTDEEQEQEQEQEQEAQVPTKGEVVETRHSTGTSSSSRRRSKKQRGRKSK
ncbi:hypothetical protein BBJ28_00014023 [Nothophytophthora sp. Chile5]|nr:hypothetical protein BBJ28_00014023 [Nothophytophthora sp. Chile5]